jgi:SRSO17 transposase
VIVDALGNPLALRLTGGQVHDITQAEALAAEAQPEALLGDKGYDADAFIESLEVRSIKPVIPPKSNRKVARDCAQGHRDREQPFRAYCAGLLGTEGRKSVEPLAAATAPSRVSGQHQSLLHFVGQSEWSDAAVLAEVRAYVLPAMERRGPIEAWIIDDTSFPKQGRHSVGVARQYCGQLGNCQNAVTLSLANHHASLPVGYRLYLPQAWAEDAPRRKQAGVSDDVDFATKPAIALGLLRRALAQNIARGLVLAEAGYGSDTAFREAVTALGLPYVMGVGQAASVWAPGVRPLTQAKPWRGRGRRPLPRLRRDAERKPVSVKELALNLPKQAWQVVKWREGSNDVLKGRFARLRVHAAHRDNLRSELRPEEWLIIEWPETDDEPANYWLSTLPEDIAFDQLVEAIKLRWRIERDYHNGRGRPPVSTPTKAADGAASTTTPRCASPLTDS